MEIILVPLLKVVYIALDIYMWIVLAMVIFSWLLAFGVVNTYNRAVRVIGDVLHRLTEPVLAPLRRVMPNFGAVDLSPIALWLLIIFAQMVVAQLIMAI